MPPAEPTLSIVNDLTGTSVTATVAGDPGVTNRLYYRVSDDGAWTAGAERLDDGAIVQTGLVPGALYTLVAVSTDGEFGLPSAPVRIIPCASDVPVVERIALFLLAQLQALVAAGAIADVQRPATVGILDSPGDLYVVLYQDEPSLPGDGLRAPREWRQPFICDCYSRVSDDDPAAADEAINLLRANVEKKLCEDPTCGGVAVDLTIDPPMLFDVPSGGYQGVRVRANVFYRTVEADPFTQA